MSPQALVLVVLVGRLLQHASFQPRLAVIAGAINKLLRDLPYLVRGGHTPLGQGRTHGLGLGSHTWDTCHGSASGIIKPHHQAEKAKAGDGAQAGWAPPCVWPQPSFLAARMQCAGAFDGL